MLEFGSAFFASIDPPQRIGALPTRTGLRASHALSYVAAALLFVGCAANRPAAHTAAGQQSTGAASTTCDPARDRAAIAAMAGAFAVTFDFTESEALTPGYQPRPPAHTDATEVVTLLEQSERKLVLQHVLLIEVEKGKFEPMKHWRQDWTFEDDELFEFRGKETFERKLPAPADATCSWSQAVFEVTDAPRYESVGRFQHEGDRSTWTSRETWRPLPRREYTKRSDYDVLVGVNKHVISPDGWLHDQDNVKLVLADGRKLVREHGENRYRRAPLEQAQRALDYMRDTGTFWSAVRAEWQAILSKPGPVVLPALVGGKPLYELLFPMAEQSRELPSEALQKRVQETIQPYVQDAH